MGLEQQRGFPVFEEPDAEDQECRDLHDCDGPVLRRAEGKGREDEQEENATLDRPVCPGGSLLNGDTVLNREAHGVVFRIYVKMTCRQQPNSQTFYHKEHEAHIVSFVRFSAEAFRLYL